MNIIKCLKKLLCPRCGCRRCCKPRRPKPPPDSLTIIRTAEQLYAIRDNLSGNYRLGNDIDLINFLPVIDRGWEPIGRYKLPFTGSFDGNGYKITGLWINRPTGEDVGLFGNIDGAVIKNLTVEIAYEGITGMMFIGGIAGFVGDDSEIINCHVYGSVAGGNVVGGIAGGIGGGNNIINCSSAGTVSGNITVGGIAGVSYFENTMEFCYSTSDVAADNNISGGFIGYATTGTIIENCYAAGDVSGLQYVGGFIGYNEESSNAIRNCYSVGEVSGDYIVGGFAGHTAQGSTSACFFDTDTSGQYNGSGYNLYEKGIHGRTTAQMKHEKTFTEYNWNFDDVWDIDEGFSYPFLQSNPPG